MEEKTIPQASASSPIWERLEVVIREQIQRFIQAVQEEEVTPLFGRRKAVR